MADPTPPSVPDHDGVAGKNLKVKGIGEFAGALPLTPECGGKRACGVEDQHPWLAAGEHGHPIHQALLDVERREARRQEVRALIEMDGLDLRDEEVMARAWRC